MACNLGCTPCTKTTPDPPATKIIGGVVYHSTIPDCHPRAVEAPFQLGKAHAKVLVSLALDSRTENVSWGK